MTSTRIAIVAPASPISKETAAKARAVAETLPSPPALDFHPQCFLSAGHFAGSDAERSAAFLDAANDGAYDAVWFARGGYGSCRLAEGVFEKLNREARAKTYLGYSDMGSLLARLFGMGAGRCVHGPMPQDIARKGGETAVRRALSYLCGDTSGVEPTIGGAPTVAFNLTTLAHCINAPWAPDLSDHVIMLEEVGEYHYRIDRAFFTIMNDKGVRKARGLRLGRCSDIPENDRPFGAGVEEMARYWCDKAGVPFLGFADIGHDVENRIVPFGA